MNYYKHKIGCYSKDLEDLRAKRSLKFRFYELVSKITIGKNADSVIIREIQSWNIQPKLVITK